MLFCLGSVEMRLNNRYCYAVAGIIGDEDILWTIPIEGLDLVLRTQLWAIDVKTESPNLPVLLEKQAQG